MDLPRAGPTAASRIHALVAPAYARFSHVAQPVQPPDARRGGVHRRSSASRPVHILRGGGGAAADDRRGRLLPSSTSRRFATIEMAADAVARKIFIGANRTFNAPIDREDILALAHVLDDAVDLIEDTAKGIQRYGVRDISRGNAGDGGRGRRSRRGAAEGHAVPRFGGEGPQGHFRALRAGRRHRGPRRRSRSTTDSRACARSCGPARSTRSATSTARSSTSSSRTSSTSATTSRTRSSPSPPSTCERCAADRAQRHGRRRARPARPDRTDRGCAAVRLPERPARRGELDRDGGRDARAAAADRRRVGGVLQLHRVRGVRPARGANGRHGHRERRRGRWRGHLRRADRRHRLERRHLEPGHSVEQQSRAHRRADRRRASPRRGSPPSSMADLAITALGIVAVAAAGLRARAGSWS